MGTKKSKRNSTLWKVCIIISIIGAILSFMGGSILGGIFYILLLVISIAASKSANTQEIPSKQQKKIVKSSEPSSAKKPSQLNIDSIGKVLETNIPNIPLQPTPIHIEEPATSSNITEKHHITGISHYMDNLMQLAEENYEYDYSKRELIDNMLEGERIYQYEFDISKTELIEEPTNPYDPNAIKVVLDGLHVGYIKKGSCARIKKLLSSDRIVKISSKVGGGKYKYLSCEYDYEKDKDVYELERDSVNFFVDIILELKEIK